MLPFCEPHFHPLMHANPKPDFLAVTKWLTVSLTLAVILGWGGTAVAANDGAGAMAAIEVMRDVQLEAASRPLKDLATKYREALEKKRTAAQESGNLESLVAVKAELELLAEGDDTAPPPKAADLAKLRQIYRDQKAKVAPQVEAALLAVDRDYAKELNKLVVDLTKAGKGDEALKVREKLDAFVKEQQAKRQQEAAAKLTPPGNKPVAEDKPAGLDALKKLLVEGSWTWHSGDENAPAYGTIRLLEGGKISGLNWLTAWEVTDASTFKIFFQNNPSNYWRFKLAKNRKYANSVEGDGAMKGPKALKHVKE